MKKITQHFFKLVIIGFATLFVVPLAEAQQKESLADDNAVQVLSGLMNDTVNVLYGTKPMKYITGAVSTISGKEIENVSGSNRLNALSGRLGGLTVTQTEGLPGFEAPTLDVRGNHTFGANGSPIILVDGRYTDYTTLDPYDIESITVLKDAAATVMYGLRSTNGIILITTKKGQSGKIKVSFNTETSLSQPTRMPEFLDAYQYATLYNEAQLNDNLAATVKYDAAALEGFRTGSDPLKYPNVDWTKMLLKDYSMQTRGNLSVSGGGKNSKYYVSAYYLHDNGLFDVDKDLNTYNTNSAMNVMSTHGNVELDITDKLTFNADLRLSRDVRNAPGTYNANFDETIFTYLFSTPFAAHPVKNADGSMAGTADYQNNPYGLLNQRGYSIWEHTSLAFSTGMTYDLGTLLKGLKLKGNFGYTNFNDYYINRIKTFATYQLNADGTTYTKRGTDTSISTSAGAQANISRYYDQSASLTYDALFGKHSISALLMYQREQIELATSADLTDNYQGPKGNFSYMYDERYLVDIAFSYQGSEQFPKGSRYGLFPAISAGWIVSNERFFEGSADESLISFLKLRGSYGITGNMPSSYFAYLGSFAAGTAYPFGITPANQTSYYQNRIVQPVDWEKSVKANAGIDLALFKNKLSATFDYFTERNEDIAVSGAITQMYGAAVSNPIGIFENKGFGVQLGWKDKINKFEYYVNGNFGMAQNKNVFSDEQHRDYPWMYTTGHPTGSRYGYVFDRFFTEDDFQNGELLASLPDQSLQGTQQPGDLKYKDLSGDGKIDANDQKVIGLPKVPEINYGVSVGFKINGLDFNVLFQGTENSTTYNSGYTYWDFYGKIGNVSEHHLDRWLPGSGQNAGYPRLTISNTNNYVSSSYWVQDNSFIRFKYAELGYTLPENLSKKIGMSKLRFFVNGNNLFVWSKVETKDPELQDNGLAYPIPRTFSAGFNINF